MYLILRKKCLQNVHSFWKNILTNKSLRNPETPIFAESSKTVEYVKKSVAPIDVWRKSISGHVSLSDPKMGKIEKFGTTSAIN